VLRLDDFPKVELGALWPGKKTPLIQTFLDETQRRVEAVTGG
jgi:hypothetical protein